MKLKILVGACFTFALFGLNNRAAVAQVVKAQYLKPEIISSPYNFIRLGDHSLYFGGLMHNINDPLYGDGDDFSIFTYNNRDLILKAGTGNVILNHTTNAGNVGIGLINPIEKLHVAGNSQLDGRLKIKKSGTMGSKYTSAAAGLIVGDGNIDLIMDGNEIYSNHLLFIGSHEDHPISLGNVNESSFNSQLHIEGNGNVGIGTTAPRTKLDVLGPIESHGAKVTSFANISSDIMLTSNTYRSFEGSAFTNGDGGSIGKYFQYRSIHGGYLNYNGNGYGFYSQGGYPRMFMEVISGNHGGISSLPSDSPIQSGYIYQQIKGPSTGPTSEPVKATDINSQWLWGVKANGEVVIATGVRTKEVTVTVEGFPDYVFDKDYSLMPLAELETFININHHLPEVPSAKEVEANGLQVGETNKLLLRKIEELTLHTINQEKQINKLKSEKEDIRFIVTQLKQELEKIKNSIDEK